MGFVKTTRQVLQLDVDPAREPTATARRDDLRGKGYAAGAAALTPSGGSGRLPAAVQAKMEGAFGADFSGVEVTESSGEAARVGARAMTQGETIQFAPGAYAPGTSAGQELIGHELTHVLQQRAGQVSATVQAKGLAINDDPALERQADECGTKAAAGQRVTELDVQASPGTGSGIVQRDGDFTELGSGCDKTYFHDGVSGMGWLETASEIKEAELKAYGALKEKGVTCLPEVDGGTAAPDKLVTKGGAEKGSSCGYWIQHIPQFSFKPKMCVMMVPRSFKGGVRALGQGEHGEERVGTLKTGLGIIQEQIDAISSIVGELTIAVDTNTGKPYILDVAPNTSGDVGGEDLADKGGKGLTRLQGTLPSD